MKTPRDTRTAILGAVAGIVVLGLMVAFAVLLPKLSPAEGADPPPVGLGEVDLPDEVPGGWRAIDLGAEGVPPEQIESLTANTAYADEVLDTLADGGGDSRQYVNEDLTAAPIVQVYGEESGPLIPEQLVDPDAFDLSRPPFEVVERGEVTCEVEWSEIDPQTQQPLPEPQVIAVGCQRTAPGLTVRLSGGVDLEQSVDLVNTVWELNAGA